MTNIENNKTEEVICCTLVVIVILIVIICLAKRCKKAERFDPGDGDVITRYHAKNLAPKLYGMDDLSAM